MVRLRAQYMRIMDALWAQKIFPQQIFHVTKICHGKISLRCGDIADNLYSKGTFRHK